MKKYYKAILSLFIVVLLSSSRIGRAEANQVIFSDDFSNGLTKWEPTRDDGAPWSIVNGRATATVSQQFKITELVPKDEFWNTSDEKIKIDFDIFPESGVDANFTMRFHTISDFYEVHFVNGGIYFDRSLPPHSTSVAGSLTYGYSSHVTIEYNVQNIKLFINGSLSADINDTTNPFVSGKIGIKVGTGTAGTTQVGFDNIVVTSIDATPSPTPTPTPTPTASPTASPTATPTASPTPTPTPTVTPSPTPTPTPTPSPTPVVTPTPTPSPTPFPFPFFYQIDEPWQSHDYDKARSWATLSQGYSIHNWGCALTDAVMILRYYGISELPNHQPINPDTLNSWLLLQPHGYINGGNVNWQSIAMIAKYASEISDHALPDLEYKWLPASLSTMYSLLLSPTPQPVIAEVQTSFGKHFITAYHAPDDSHIEIADPYFPSRTLFSAYGNAAASLRSFTPSHTNLGYLMAYGDPSMQFSLQKKGSSEYQDVSGADVFTEGNHGNPFSGQPGTAGAFRALEYAKPEPGEYRLEVSRSTPGVGHLLLLSYDQGAAETAIEKDLLLGTNPQEIDVTYRATGSAAIKRHVTFETLESDLALLRMRKGKHAYRGEDLEMILRIARTLYPKNRKHSRQFYDLFTRLIVIHKRQIDPLIYPLLRDDARAAREELY